MKLSQLIQQADTIYDLALGETDKRELQRRLASAGYESEFDSARTPDVIDAVLQTADSLRSRRNLAVASYSGLKVEAAPQQDGCPRCHQQMKRVELVNDRNADYCQSCAITLPIRA